MGLDALMIPQMFVRVPKVKKASDLNAATKDKDDFPDLGGGQRGSASSVTRLRADNTSADGDESPAATRITLRPHDPGTGEEIEKREVVKGYEYARGEFVTFTAEELKALDVESSGVTSGLVLAVAAVLPSGPEYVTPLGTINVTLGLGIVTLALGAAGTFFGYLARDQGRISRWQARRGEAEIARLDVFTTIAGKAAEAGPAVALHGLALVVRHLLDDQRNWLGARAASQEILRATSRWGGLANALTFIGGSGAIIASQAKGSIWIVLSGLIGAAIAAYAANRDALRRDRANADRYEKAQVALDGLSGRTDDVAARIAAGEPKALVAFTDAVTDLLATEHKQWLEGTAQAEASLCKLDAQLRQLTDTKK